MSHNYVCVDFLKKNLWNNINVEWWYAQNCVIYVNKEYSNNNNLKKLIEQYQCEPLSLVHPKNYLSKINLPTSSLKNAIYILYKIINIMPKLIMREIYKIIQI